MRSLLERDGETAALLTAVEQARAGSGSLVLLGGEAGIGKTALVRPLLGRDQHDNAALGEELGAGIALAEGVDGDELTAALAAAMGSAELRDSTAALAGRLTAYDPGPAVAAVETAARSVGRRGTRRRPVHVQPEARRAGAARTSVTGP